jgi:hypothetical protein
MKVWLCLEGAGWNQNINFLLCIFAIVLGGDLFFEETSRERDILLNWGIGTGEIPL